MLIGSLIFVAYNICGLWGWIKKSKVRDLIVAKV